MRTNFRQSPEYDLLEAMLARAVADALHVKIAKRSGDSLCEIYVAELDQFMLEYPKLVKRIKALRSNREVKRCLKKIERILNRP